eukprot:1317199-Amphidinium_carterae.1
MQELSWGRSCGSGHCLACKRRHLQTNEKVNSSLLNPDPSGVRPRSILLGLFGVGSHASQKQHV